MGFPKSYSTTVLNDIFSKDNQIALLTAIDTENDTYEEPTISATTGYQRYIIKDGDFSVNDGVATTAKHILLFLALEYVGYIVGFAVFSGNGTTLKYLGELAGKTVGENTVPVFKIYDESKGEGIKVTLDVKTTSSVSVTDVS